MKTLLNIILLTVLSTSSTPYLIQKYYNDFHVTKYTQVDQKYTVNRDNSVDFNQWLKDSSWDSYLHNISINANTADMYRKFKTNPQANVGGGFYFKFR